MVARAPAFDKVCVVTVTYGDRYRLLVKVVERVVREGVKVIVVDNASVGRSRELIGSLPRRFERVVSAPWKKSWVCRRV